jgi:catechol 2,3-dioxygenase-like lactoylglutathione lyase family enzyme
MSCSAWSPRRSIRDTFIALLLGHRTREPIVAMQSDVKHVHLASRDHDVSLRFYETYFGFRFDSIFLRGDQPAATVLRSPTGFQVYLEGVSGERLPSWFHFGFLVESAADCRELHDRMRRDGVTIVRPLVSEPFTNYFFADPDEHLVQVYFDPRAK